MYRTRLFINPDGLTFRESYISGDDIIVAILEERQNSDFWQLITKSLYNV